MLIGTSQEWKKQRVANVAKPSLANTLGTIYGNTKKSTVPRQKINICFKTSTKVLRRTPQWAFNTHIHTERVRERLTS